VGGVVDRAHCRRAPPVFAPGQAVSIFGTLARFGALATLLLWQSGCRPPASPAAGTRIVDDAGDTVVVPVAARRVVSLIPATTELLFAIGAGPAVIGRTAWCDYPAAAAKVPNLGDGIAPNVEAVLASRPDLVILYNSAQNAGIAARLRRLGIAALRLNTDSLGDVDRVGRLLGRLTGHALAAATVSSPPRRPKVLLLVWEQPPMTIGRGSFLSELVERAGGRNLFADVTSSAGTVSIEAVASRDPDLILTTTAGPAGFAERPEWQTVRAVRERRFLPVSGSEFNRPSPRAPDAIRELARLLRERGSMRKPA
jgi:iron complex transport system substrate-binding protein